MARLVVGNRAILIQIVLMSAYATGKVSFFFSINAHAIQGIIHQPVVGA